MFNWLKKLFGKTDDQLDPAFPFPKAKEVDESHMAPYKVEAPEPQRTRTPDGKFIADDPRTEHNEAWVGGKSPAKTAPKKPRAPKKKTSTSTGQGRGRKPKAKPAQ